MRIVLGEARERDYVRWAGKREHGKVQGAPDRGGHQNCDRGGRFGLVSEADLHSNPMPLQAAIHTVVSADASISSTAPAPTNQTSPLFRERDWDPARTRSSPCCTSSISGPAGGGSVSAAPAGGV